MNTPNFICIKTKQKFYIPKFRISFTKTGKVYIDSSTGAEVRHPDTNEKLECIEKKGEYDVGVVSGSVEQKQKMKKWMKDRSTKHFNKELKDVKTDMIKKSIPQ